MVQISSEISTPFEVCVLGEWQKCTLPSPPFTKDERLGDIEHSVSIGNLIWDVNSVTVSYLTCYDSLLQNATDIITKRDIDLLQDAPGLLLQNMTVITNCENLITKCDSYYKMRRLLQIATGHW